MQTRMFAKVKECEELHAKKICLEHVLRQLRLKVQARDAGNKEMKKSLLAIKRSRMRWVLLALPALGVTASIGAFIWYVCVGEEPIEHYLKQYRP